MQKFPLWRADSYVGSTGYVWTEAVSGIARSRLSDRGEGAKEWGGRECKRRAKSGAGRENRKFLPFCFFVFALSQFRGPDYLGAWNRLYPERQRCGLKNIRIRVTGPQEDNIIPKRKHRCCVENSFRAPSYPKETAISS